MRRAILLSVMAAYTAGCATSAQDIKAVPVPPGKYANLDCAQIEAELDKSYTHGAELRRGIDADAAGDAAAVGIGAMLFLPIMLFAIGDADEADEYGRLKGEYQALQAAGTEKKCAIEYKPLQEPTAIANQLPPGSAGRN